MPLTSIDDRVVRVDAEAKARGEAMYVADYSFPDMLYAYMVRSSVPRGRILDIHVPQLPDGYYFISAKDIPENGRNELWMIQKDWRCFADGDVRYVGETIGLLVKRWIELELDSVGAFSVDFPCKPVFPGKGLRGTFRHLFQLLVRIRNRDAGGGREIDRTFRMADDLLRNGHNGWGILGSENRQRRDQGDAG